MAKFAYTYASWDSVRPTTLGKTGLGDALKTYEKLKNSLARNGTDCVTKYVDAVDGLGEAEKARDKAVAACGKSALYKKAKEFLETASVESEQKTLAAFLGNHIVNVIGDYPAQATKHLNIMRKRVELLEKALDLYKSGKTVPDPVKKIVEERVGSDSQAGLRKFNGQDEFKEFYSKRSAFKKLLPDVVKKCEDLKSALDELPTVQKRLSEVDSALQPYVKGA